MLTILLSLPFIITVFTNKDFLFPDKNDIVNGIENYVALGILKEKTQIPSIREMASNLGINPNTVKKSYDILENKGIITTISTKGTFIADDTKKATNDKIDREINIIKEKIINLTLFLEKL